MLEPQRSGRPGIFSIFLFAILGAVEALTLYSVWQVQVLPVLYLVALGAFMGAVTLVVARLLFHGRRLLWLRRFVGGVGAMLMVAVCLTGSFALFLLGDAFGSVVDESMGTAVEAPEDPTVESFAVYLSGSDTRSSTLTASRSDVNIIAVVNPGDKQVLLINTPRDYYVSNPAGGGAKDKLTHCGLKGVANSAQALSVLYGQPIAYTAQINFKGFETLIDAMGGVTVISETAFTTTIGGYRIAAGENQLSGAQALAFAQERKHLRDGDFGRGRNQMQVITGMIARLTSGSLLKNYQTVLTHLEGTFSTSMPAETMTRLVRMQLADMAPWEVFTYAVTGTDGSAGTYSTGSTKVYVMYPDGASVAKASTLMEKVLRGEKLTEEEV